MQLNSKVDLPIDPYLEQIVTEVQKHSTLFIKAPPGSGKTTRLPLALTKASSGKVLVLEPRRLAARLAAQRIAQESDLALGKDVGYHFRFEKNMTPTTPLVFYTEGTFLKRLLGDPLLTGVEMVIIDEFHERHLETDAALAYLRSLQQQRELKIILMSATLEVELIQQFPQAGLIEIDARQYPIEISHLPNQPSVLNQSLELKVRNALRSLPAESGDVLVFLPGMREMLKVKETLAVDFGEVHLLHADLPAEEQQRAIAPGTRRKIVLSTNVAESSITIAGVRVVIDSGIQREARYSPWHGMKFMADVPTTQSSAIQRAGRAGRTAPGICLRLYSLQDFQAREAFTVPEIEKADLTDLFLLSKQLTLPFHWLTPPAPERWEKARELCFKLGAVDENGELTSRGKSMLERPLGARLARVLEAGMDLTPEARRKLLAYIGHEIENDKSGRLEKRLQNFVTERPGRHQDWERAILHGFIDQVAKLRPGKGDLIHYSGKVLKLHHSLSGQPEGFYLVFNITQRQEAIGILPIEEEWLYELEPFPFNEEVVFTVSKKFSLSRQTRLGSILLEEEVKTPSWDGLKAAELSKLLLQAEKPFKEHFNQWHETDAYLRLHFYARLSGQDAETFTPSLRQYLEFAQSFSWDFVTDFFSHYLGHALAVQDIEERLPGKIRLGGREFKVHYPLNMDPFVEAPIHEFYGLTTTPSINKGQTVLAMKLLGPHKRPIQVTKDLAGFWQRTYREMKKELMRDYPRHHWPDDPATARPVLLKRML
jgi:ATP-dependent helicase HrpB